MGVRSPALLLLAVLPLACGSPRVSWEGSWNAPYGALDPDQRKALAAARDDQAAGRLEQARRRLATLLGGAPDNLELGVVLQDVERQLLERGDPANPQLAEALAGHPEPAEALRSLYASRAEASPSVAGFVLAARAETDAIAEQTLLERALELDPSCAWAHYGRAHALLRDRPRTDRWVRAREALARALQLDPAHLRARRLEAWIFAQEGDAAAAARALEVWLRRTAGDPRVVRAERLTAQLDLAIAWVMSGHSPEAVSLLAGLEGEPHERSRRLAVLAVALHQDGQFEAALDAARRAESAEPGSLLPVVQQALLLQHDLGDPEAAEARWRAVAEGGGADLASMLQVLRARVELERGDGER